VKTVSRVSGLVLLLLVLLPLHRLGNRGLPGSPAEHLRSLSESYFQASWAGLLAAAFIALILGFTPLPRQLARWGAVSARWLLVLSPRWFALGVGMVAAALTLALSLHAFALQPTLLDATSQLIHARYMASGSPAGPTLEHPEFFTFQYMVNLPSGWSSQYPPGHIWALAAGFFLGVPWLVGPLLALLAVALTSRLGEELLDDPLTARLGAVLLALSPFFLGHNATYMNHASAAAWGVAALFCIHRGGTSSRAQALITWSLLGGVAAGMVAATRPLGGLTILVVALTLVLRSPAASNSYSSLRTRAVQMAAFALGALGPVLLTAHHNAALFGHPARFGYDVAQGPGHAPGFHLDPWGQVYTPLEGLAQTSSALVALGMDLLLTPFSALVLVALVLLFRRPPSLPGLGPLVLWAGLPVVLHFFYWHHDLFLGPRLLHEFTPAWALLVAVAAVEAGRRTSRVTSPGAGPRLDSFGALLGLLWLGAASALLLFAPIRFQMYVSQWGEAARIALPEPGEPALVFVHGDWSDRLSARLAATGMRTDSVRAAVRYTTSCELQEHLDARESDVAPANPLQFRPMSDRPLEELVLPSGTRIVTAAGESPTPACTREVVADRLGTLDLPPLLWRGDLPGINAGGALFARDLGPELNARLLARYPQRRALFYLPSEPSGPPLLLPYHEAVRRLWSGGVEGD
jgi:hypothetical protein